MSTEQTIKDGIKQCQALHANGNYQQAEALALRCITLSTDINDPALHFRSVTALGHVRRAQDEFSDALDAYTAALNLAKANLDNECLAISWLHIGLLFMQGSVWDVAIECFERITKDAALCKAACLYKAYDNLAACHLHCNNIPQSLADMRQSQRQAPNDFCDSDPYGYMFSRHTLVQLLIRNAGTSTQNELMNAVLEARRCRILNPNNRSVNLLCDLIEGSVGVAYGSSAFEREASVALIYRAHQTARYVNELMVDVLASLVQAEFMIGRTDRMQEHLQALLALSHEDSGWQAAQKLGLHQNKNVGRILSTQWPELNLGKHSIYATSGPQLPLMLRRALSKWIGANEHSNAEPVYFKGRMISGAESSVLAHVRLGRTNAEIADLTGLCKQSVKRFIKGAYKSFAVSSRAALTQYLEAHIATSSDYLRWLADHDFDAALKKWYFTSPKFRDSNARLIICLIMELLARHEHAQQESAYLLPEAGNFFILFSDWRNGVEAALPKLIRLLENASPAHRYPILLAVYFGCIDHKKYKVAAEIACSL